MGDGFFQTELILKVNSWTINQHKMAHGILIMEINYKEITNKQ